MVGPLPSLAEDSPAAGGNTWLKPEWCRIGSVVEFRFTALGTPAPKARPRTVRNKQTNQVSTYTPEATVNWEQAVAWQAKQALSALAVMHPGEYDCLPIKGRLVVDLQFHVKRAASLPKKVKYPMNSRPGDIDNLAKSVLDALQTVRIIEDDKTVTDLSCSKRFADDQNPEGVLITLTGWID